MVWQLAPIMWLICDTKYIWKEIVMLINNNIINIHVKSQICWYSKITTYLFSKIFNRKFPPNLK